MSRGLITIALLALSNIFMTLAWSGHLKFGEMRGFQKLGLIAIILISWGLPYSNIVRRSLLTGLDINRMVAHFHWSS